MESTTSELGCSKSSSGIGGTSEVSADLDQCTRSISIESNGSITKDMNGRFIDDVIDEKMDDIDNNNGKFIDHGSQEGRFYFLLNYI